MRKGERERELRSLCSSQVTVKKLKTNTVLSVLGERYWPRRVRFIPPILKWQLFFFLPSAVCVHRTHVTYTTLWLNRCMLVEFYYGNSHNETMPNKWNIINWPKLWLYAWTGIGILIADYLNLCDTRRHLESRHANAKVDLSYFWHICVCVRAWTYFLNAWPHGGRWSECNQTCDTNDEWTYHPIWLWLFSSGECESNTYILHASAIIRRRKSFEHFVIFYWDGRWLLVSCAV